MILKKKKHDVIIFFTYFIILLYLVRVNAQNKEPSPTTTTPNGATPTSSTQNITETCLKEASCKDSNDTLRLCNGFIKFPDKFIQEGILRYSYKPESRSLAKCMCNQPYYDTFSACLECFSSVTKTEFKVLPLQEYKNECKEQGTTFTQTMPPPSTGIPFKLKLGLIAAIIVLFLGLLGFLLFKYYKKKRVKPDNNNDGGNYGDKYPPPPPDYTHQYAPPVDYPPPTSHNTPYYPPPSGTPGSEYPPPAGTPGSEYPPPPPHGGQGDKSGQSDSYYRGNY